MIALSALLSYVRIYQAPNGGSVTAGSMIPIMIFAIRWGLGPGLAVGATYGLLDFILKRPHGCGAGYGRRRDLHVP